MYISYFRYFCSSFWPLKKTAHTPRLVQRSGRMRTRKFSTSTNTSSTSRFSMSRRVSLSAYRSAQREAFTCEEARDAHATDLALRTGNKDPTLVCVSDVRGYTPLHVAASLGKEDVVKLLTSHDARTVNIKARMGLTPLLVAVGSRQWKVCQMLVAAGAELVVKDASGRSPYDLALDEEAPDHVLEYLYAPKSSRLQGSTSAFSSKKKANASPAPFSSVVDTSQISFQTKQTV